MHSQADTKPQNGSEAALSLVDVVADQHSIDVLRHTDAPQTIDALADRIGIPVWVCEQRVHKLETTGLVERHSPDSHDGVDEPAFQRDIHGVEISFSDTEVSTSVEEASSTTDQLVDVWDDLRNAA